MLLTDLLHLASHLWTPSSTHSRSISKERMIIPNIKDLASSREAAKVDAQLRECSRLLASHLYVWRKPFPAQATVKSWSPESLSFVGMDIDVFRCYVMDRFTLRTDDNHEWLLDRAVADLIWRSCTAADSPLPEASWSAEMALKRLAGRREVK
jgi:hypothetical protein